MALSEVERLRIDTWNHFDCPAKTNRRQPFYLQDLIGENYVEFGHDNSLGCWFTDVLLGVWLLYLAVTMYLNKYKKYVEHEYFSKLVKLVAQLNASYLIIQGSAFLIGAWHHYECAHPEAWCHWISWYPSISLLNCVASGVWMVTLLAYAYLCLQRKNWRRTVITYSKNSEEQLLPVPLRIFFKSVFIVFLSIGLFKIKYQTNFAVDIAVSLIPGVGGMFVVAFFSLKQKRKFADDISSKNIEIQNIASSNPTEKPIAKDTTHDSRKINNKINLGLGLYIIGIFVLVAAVVVQQILFASECSSPCPVGCPLNTYIGNIANFNHNAVLHCMTMIGSTIQAIGFAKLLFLR